MNKFHKSHYTGIIGESMVITKLLSMRLEAFKPLLDINGCDLIVRLKSGKYLRLQIKTSILHKYHNKYNRAYFIWNRKMDQYDFDLFIGVILDKDNKIICYYIIPRFKILPVVNTLCINPFNIYKDRFGEYKNNWAILSGTSMVD